MMAPKTGLPLPPGYDNDESYVRDLLDFTSTSNLFQLLTGGVHILDFFIRDPDMYSWLLDEEWRSWFDLHSRDALLYLFLREDLSKFSASAQAPERWTDEAPPPQSLIDYISKIRALSLQRDFPSKAEDRCCTERDAALPRDIALGMKVKKVHEVGHFARYVHRLTSDVATMKQRRVSHLVDFGSGQNYLGRTLASPLYKKNVVAVESRHHNIERSKILDINSKMMPKPEIMRNKKLWRQKGFPTWKLPPEQRYATTDQPDDSTDQALKPQKRVERDGIGWEYPDTKPDFGQNGTIDYVEQHLEDGDLSAVVSEIVQTPMDGRDERWELGVEANNGSLLKKTPDPTLLVISLHSCGNLTHHGLRSLMLNPHVDAVAMVGCCYNLVTERLNAPTHKIADLDFTHPPDLTKPRSMSGDPHGYPMSERILTYTNPKLPANTPPGIPLNITARMMAVQAPQNWQPSGSDDFFTRHFYRALLQKIFLDRGVVKPPVVPEAPSNPNNTRQFPSHSADGRRLSPLFAPTADDAAGGATQPIIIGCMRKAYYTSFTAYVRGAVGKLTRDPPRGGHVIERMAGITDAEIEAYATAYAHRKQHLAIVWSLMAYSAALVEAVIVVDRWLWLKEQEQVAEAWVEPVFEYSKSPRNLVVVGIKK